MYVLCIDINVFMYVVINMNLKLRYTIVIRHSMQNSNKI